jgi:hypothetical protein
VENFISNVTRVNEKYDTILCLSLTKWIHLNWGDEGIKRLFTKVNESLYPRYNPIFLILGVFLFWRHRIGRVIRRRDIIVMTLRRCLNKLS